MIYNTEICDAKLQTTWIKKNLSQVCIHQFYKQALRKQYSQQIHYMVSLEKQNQLMYLSFQVCK
jgi:hypothetical protein